MFSQKEANHLYSLSSFLIFLNIPPSFEFGIDGDSWTTGPKFKGIKLIPPGIHFFTYRHSSNESELKTGRFVNLQPKEIKIFKWNHHSLLMEEADFTENSQWPLERLQTIDDCLGVYPIDSCYKKWLLLTKHIKWQRILQIIPNLNLSSMTSSNYVCADDLPDLSANNPLEVPLKFNLIPFKSLPLTESSLSLSASDITKYGMDKTWLYLQLISSDNFDLSDFQLSFIIFTVAENFEGFEHWKSIIHLASQCLTLPTLYPQQAKEFITALLYQIQQCPKEFFSDVITENNFIYEKMQSIIENYLEAEEFVGCIEKLKRILKEKFDWSFDFEF